MADDIGDLVVKVGMDSKLFQDGVTKLNKQMNLLQSEFKATASNVKVFGDSTEQMKTKVDYLSRMVEMQKSKVQQLAQAYQKTKEETGEYSNQTTQAGISLNKAIAYLNNMESQLKDTSRELDIQSSRWQKLSTTMNSAADKMKSVGQTLANVGKGLTTSVTLPILGIGVASTKMAMDAVESENLFSVSFGKMEKSARQWSEETSKALGLNAFELRRNAATYYTMLTSMGLTEQEAYKMSTSFTQLSYDMASFYNIKPEEAFEKLKAGITGEAEPLKALGVLINETTTEAYAMDHGIGKLTKTKEGFKRELSETDKVMARYGLIIQSTSKAQGDLGRTMDSPTNQLRMMKEQLSQLGIQFGQILIPVLQKLIAIIKPLLDKFQGMNKEQQEMIVKIALIAAAVGPLLLVLGNLIITISGVVSVFSKVSIAIAEAGGVIALLTGPVGIAIAAIAGFISIVIALWKTNEDFRKAVISIWDNIKSVIVSICDYLKSFWAKWGNDILSYFSSVWKSIGAVLTTAIKVLNDILKIFIAVFKGDWKSAWEGVKSIFIDMWNGIGEFFKGIPSLMLNWGKNAVQGFIDGIKAKFPAVTEAVSGVMNRVKGFLGFNSPAKEGPGRYITVWGSNMISGFMDGIENQIPSLKNLLNNALPIPTGNVVNTAFASSMGSYVPQKSYTKIEIPVILDGREIARVSAPYLDNIQGNNFKTTGRGQGIR